MSKVSGLGHLGVAFETTYGTAVAPALYVPYDTIKVEDDISKVSDSGRRGVVSATDFAVYNTTRKGSVEIDSLAYADTLGFFLKAVFGQDTVTGSSPYSHKFTAANALCPSLTVQDYNAITERQYAGALVTEVGLKFDSEKEMSMSTKIISKASVTTTQTNPTISTTKPFMGFQAALKIAGSPNLNMVGGEVTVKREATLIFGANNTQDPTKFATGRISVEGKLTFDVEDESEWLNYANAVQPTLDILFTADANTTLDLSFGKVDFTKAVVDRSNEFVRVDVDFKALYNATDNGVATFTLKNAVASY